MGFTTHYQTRPEHCSLTVHGPAADLAVSVGLRGASSVSLHGSRDGWLWRQETLSRVRSRASISASSHTSYTCGSIAHSSVCPLRLVGSLPCIRQTVGLVRETATLRGTGTVRSSAIFEVRLRYGVTQKESGVRRNGCTVGQARPDSKNIKSEWSAPGQVTRTEGAKNSGAGVNLSTGALTTTGQRVIGPVSF